MVERTDFGKLVMKELVEIGQNQQWLIGKINEKLDMKIDSAYFCHIMSGKRRSPRVDAAIREILGLQDEKEEAREGTDSI